MLMRHLTSKALFKKGLQHYLTHLRLLLVLTVAAGIVGCSPMSSKVGGVLNLDTDLKVTLVAASDINPNESGRPSPVYVSLYELKTDTLFNKSDFLTLYEKDEEALGKDLLAKTALKPITPGTEREKQFELHKETQYVALFAEFLQYRDAKYKIIFPVTKNNVFRNAVTVELSENQLLLVETTRSASKDSR